MGSKSVVPSELLSMLKTGTPPAPVDDLGILGLSAIIRRAHAQPESLALGLDSESVIQTTGPATALLCQAAGSPWASGPPVPAVYRAEAVPPAAGRMAAFAEETLFYMFYAMPRDRMQELAAHELTVNRAWRLLKADGVWFKPSSALVGDSLTEGISALRLSPGPAAGSARSYIVWDPVTWSKVRRELPPISDEMVETRFGVGAV